MDVICPGGRRRAGLRDPPRHRAGGARTADHRARASRHLLGDKYSFTLHAMRGLRVRAGRASERVLDGMAGADFRARLGVSLTQALIELGKHRQEAAFSPGLAVTPTPPDRRRPLVGYAVRFRRPIAVGVALLAVSGAGAAASSLWLSPAGNPLYGFNPGLTQSAPPPAQLNALAVLRRAQADADRGPCLLYTSDAADE